MRHYLRLRAQYALCCVLLLSLFSSQACLVDDRDKDDDEDEPIFFDPNPNTGNPSNPMTGNPDPVNNGVRIVEFSTFTTSEGAVLTHMLHLLGKPFGAEGKLLQMGQVMLTNSSSQAKEVLVKLSFTGYSEPARQKVTLSPSESKVIELTPSFDFAKIYDITSSAPASVEVEVTTIDGTLLDFASESVKIPSVNVVPWQIKSNEEVVSLFPFVTTLVTPEDRDHEIQKLITEAGKLLPEMSISGYTSDPQHTVRIAYAIFMALNRRGMIYTNVTGGYFNSSQNVKLPAQSLQTGSANCIDGALVFASAFEAIGFEPVIYIIPGHAFVGIRLQPGGDVLPIETTVVSGGDFEAAVNIATASVEMHKGKSALYYELDVKQLRRLGLTPVNL